MQYKHNLASYHFQLYQYCSVTWSLANNFLIGLPNSSFRELYFPKNNEDLKIISQLMSKPCPKFTMINFTINLDSNPNAHIVSDGVQDTSSQSMAYWHIEYFKLMVFETMAEAGRLVWLPSPHPSSLKWIIKPSSERCSPNSLGKEGIASPKTENLRLRNLYKQILLNHPFFPVTLHHLLPWAQTTLSCKVFINLLFICLNGVKLSVLVTIHLWRLPWICKKLIISVCFVLLIPPCQFNFQTNPGTLWTLKKTFSFPTLVRCHLL